MHLTLGRKSSGNPLYKTAFSEIEDFKDMLQLIRLYTLRITVRLFNYHPTFFYNI